MANLIKAEFYRVRHSGGFLLLIMFTCFFLSVALAFSDNFFDINRTSLSQSLSMAVSISAIAAAIPTGLHFHHRMAYYEIMDGKSPHAIIFGRFAVYIPMATLCFFVPVCVILMIFDGGAESVKFLALLFVILLRVLVFAICSCLTLKITEGLVIMLPRMILEMLPMVLSGGKMDFSNLDSALNWIPTYQCFSIGQNIDGLLTAQIIIGFIIEAAVMYALAYTSYRKKWCIKSTIS